MTEHLVSEVGPMGALNSKRKTKEVVKDLEEEPQAERQEWMGEILEPEEQPELMRHLVVKHKVLGYAKVLQIIQISICVGGC